MSMFADGAVVHRGAMPFAVAPSGELASHGSLPDAFEAVSARKICLMRFVLTLSSLVIIFIDPSKPDRFYKLTYISLLIYTVYSGLLCLYAARARDARLSSAALTWIDVGSYVVLIGFSGGAGSIYFFFFFFSILVASFRGGLESGLYATLVSTLLFTVVGYAVSSPQDFQLNRFALRPIYLLVLGYMVAVWGGSELLMKRRLALLKSVSRLSNPRFGIDRTVCSLMEGMRKFFGADTCLLVTQDDMGAEYFLRRADRYRADRAMKTERVAEDIGCQLISLLGGEAVAVAYGHGLVHSGPRVVYSHPPAAGEEIRQALPLDKLARLIGEVSFLSVPWRQKGGAPARLYLTSPRGRYDRGDLEFLQQVVEHAAPLMENIQLLDRLASMAAERERRRISLDLHDSTIQPYIGLKMGLESVCRKASEENPLAGDLKELLTRTESGLADLRLYVHGLKRESGGGDAPALATAIRQYADQFKLLYGIEVDSEVEPGLRIGDRLSAEAFQIVREGLSNVRRHTRARAASVRLSAQAGSLIVEVENYAAGEPWSRAPFSPRSIGERAESLGGKALVDVSGVLTLVRAEIPL